MRLSPEDHDGPIEYKVQLLGIGPERLDQLCTQMHFRLGEGGGAALYEIGVGDDGKLIGLLEDDMRESLETLSRMANKLEVGLQVVGSIHVPSSDHDEDQDPRICAEVLIQRRLEDRAFDEIRVVTIGAHESGKTTLLGVLTHGIPDNGRGRARLALLRHRHEIETGHTSSIAHEIVGYDADGEAVNYATIPFSFSSKQSIVRASVKVIDFLDCAGHPRFARQTIRGILGYAAHYALCTVAASSGEVGEVAKEYIGMCFALGVPSFVCLTKVDLATKERLRTTMTKLYAFLGMQGRVPVLVQSEGDVETFVREMEVGEGVVPVFLTSCAANLTSIPLLHTFLNALPVPPSVLDSDTNTEMGARFHVNEVYQHPTAGLIIGGVLRRGTRLPSSQSSSAIYLLGPDSAGDFVRVGIKTIHRQRIPTPYLSRGQAGTIAISIEEGGFKVRKGMVLIEVPEGGEEEVVKASGKIEVEVDAGVNLGVEQAMVYFASARASIKGGAASSHETHDGGLRTVRYEFTSGPEYVEVGESAVVTRSDGEMAFVGRVVGCVEWEGGGGKRGSWGSAKV
ncbi:P-loop containing nucleoside triphosphate hydrolase protein [Saitoella complicata NRRL Y-17804]|uniref:P-loop containing nucleoside triphosphate hydrolase protein n=1 Tax=Saitoella complicata (strain BCRC 22490 / CBS 7301 / JCM 7358 / NBRC 10748 / NRRL Y-17804) TaxID=698492 RepID=UPI00086743C4|nr:P-loop containing nucleoside triphosphate hydrolase protein [Saitoella complicata NRRL Y-17804]ODQ49604.1 P-loop containing nucleoside triphosphate hydrolase protein [Saitoella complicata NRRL Y-17804]